MPLRPPGREHYVSGGDTFWLTSSCSRATAAQSPFRPADTSGGVASRVLGSLHCWDVVRPTILPLTTRIRQAPGWKKWASRSDIQDNRWPIQFASAHYHFPSHFPLGFLHVTSVLLDPPSAVEMQLKVIVLCMQSDFGNRKLQHF